MERIAPCLGARFRDSRFFSAALLLRAEGLRGHVRRFVRASAGPCTLLGNLLPAPVHLALVPLFRLRELHVPAAAPVVRPEGPASAMFRVG